MLLSGEICLTSDRKIPVRLRFISLGSFDSIDEGRAKRWKSVAPNGVTHEVIKQKSADGIVAKRLP